MSLDLNRNEKSGKNKDKQEDRKDIAFAKSVLDKVKKAENKKKKAAASQAKQGSSSLQDAAMEERGFGSKRSLTSLRENVLEGHGEYETGYFEKVKAGNKKKVQEGEKSSTEPKEQTQRQQPTMKPSPVATLKTLSAVDPRNGNVLTHDMILTLAEEHALLNQDYSKDFILQWLYDDSNDVQEFVNSHLQLQILQEQEP
jgi:hypothetical protein